MSFNTSWPTWLQKLYPSWLEAAGLPESGVGDLQDLRLSVSIGEGGRWIGLVNTGWFYHQNKEQYHYVLRGQTLVTASAGSGQTTHSISFRPAWGPVLVSSTIAASSDFPYTQHANSFQPGTALSWSVVSSSLGIYVATIPTSSILVGMRDLTNLSMGSVTGSGNVISERLYAYDPSTRKVYIKPKNPNDIQAWADLLYNQPRLRMRELVIQEEDGVLASYRDLNDVQVIRGNQTYSAGNIASGYFTHTLTGVYNGDWVILDYWINHSYIVKDHQTIHYYTTPSSGDSFAIYYEQSVPDLIPAISLNATGVAFTGLLNVNPLFSDAHRTGFLFHAYPTMAASSQWPVQKIKVSLDKFQYNKEWNELIKVTVLCLGDNDLPVPWAPISLTSSASTTAVAYSPSLTMVDGRGEFHGLMRPASGVDNFIFLAVSALVSGFASALSVTTLDVLPTSIYTDGHVSLVVTDQKTPRGYWQSYLNKVYLDGIPAAASGIILSTKLASPIDYKNNIKIGNAILNTTQNSSNISAITDFGYLPQPTDEIAAYHAKGQSTRIQTEDE